MRLQATLCPSAAVSDAQRHRALTEQLQSCAASYALHVVAPTYFMVHAHVRDGVAVHDPAVTRVFSVALIATFERTSYWLSLPPLPLVFAYQLRA